MYHEQEFRYYSEADMTSFMGDILYEINETRIYLSDGQNGEFRGFMEHPATDRVWAFDSVMSMLSLHEKLYDSMELSGQVGFIRSGGALAGTDWDRDEDAPVFTRGQLVLPEQPTFDIQILYRQNASWQGVVRCMKHNMVQRFRSALELLMIMECNINAISVMAAKT